MNEQGVRTLLNNKLGAEYHDYYIANIPKTTVGIYQDAKNFDYEPISRDISEDGSDVEDPDEPEEEKQLLANPEPALEKALEVELCESRIHKDNMAMWEAKKASDGGNDNKRKPPSNQHNEANKRNKIGSNSYKGKKPYVEYPLCPTCSRKHPGECRLKGKTSYKCGQPGHYKKDCLQ
ncbi:hypothetical protein F8388_019516 [Cannabis sativa]|uniref:CCHC-type domain-containing protein n=1 Tax=Cannabis sativa TaxID=3483 RepID=A0A7J6EEJ8_CANSA|nr:hypothetical protein F8388_019516 [Cannabis sativa]